MRIAKDPDAVLDYAWDWTDWLAAGETITAHQLIPDDGVAIDADNLAGGVVTAWISGGQGVPAANVTCRITTSEGRTDDRTIRLLISER